MNKMKALAIPFFVVVLLLGFINPAQAVPPTPSSFYGEIHYVSGDGEPIVGDYVEAYVPGVTPYVGHIAISTYESNLVYAINVLGDDPDVAGKDGGIENDVVTFKINGRTVATGVWHGGTNVNLVIHPPKVDAGGPYAGVRDEVIDFAASVTDWSSTDTFSFAWELDMDGDFDDLILQNFPFVYGWYGSYDVTVNVTDSQGGTGSSTTLVIVVMLGGLTGQTYNGNPHPVSITQGLPEGATYSVTYDDDTTPPTNAGSYEVVVTIDGGWETSPTITRTLVIAPKSITVTADSGQTKVFGAADPTFTYVSSDPGATFTGALSRVTGENVGSYAITQGNLDAGGNYAITFVPANFTITAKPITVTADSGQTKVFGVADPTFTYVSSDPGVTFTGALSRVTGENVGSYAITQGDLDGGGNYAISFVPANFTITAKPVTVTADSGQTKVFGAADPTFTYVSSDPGATFTGALSRVAGEDVGSYAITQGDLDAGGNYAISFVSANFTITGIPVTVTADSGQTKVFGAADPTFTYVSSDPGVTFTGALSRVTGEDVGSYAITQGDLDAGGNYAITFVPANFTITAKPVTVTADSGQTKVFGAADPTFTYVSSDPGVTFTGALSRVTGENVGSYTITQGDLDAGGNYAITFVPANFTITPASASVALSNLDQTYDGTPKPATATTTPLGVGVTITYDGSEDAPSVTGAYAVVASITDPNYIGSDATGTLVIRFTHSIALVPGWNLVSFNLQPYPSTAPADVLSSIDGNYDLVYAWDGSGAHSGAGGWMKYDPAAPPVANTLDSVSTNQGIWIHMTSAATLDVTGFIPVSTDISLQIGAGGWNLVGFPSSSNSDLPAALTDLRYRLYVDLCLSRSRHRRPLEVVWTYGAPVCQ